tara:strand:+ start:2634 stop:3209 length:576 start_codon:yes stop_codon:yes gene_type:complete
MNEITNTDNKLTYFQKIIFILFSIFLVILLLFLKNGFTANTILDQLAKNSLSPNEALVNGRPTLFEFYADWCEACKEMAPSIIEIKERNENKVDVVLLNVDNPRWMDLINQYDVNGIPKLTFFNSKGEFKGSSVGIRSDSELNDIFIALSNDSELPSFTNLSNLSLLNFDPAEKVSNYKNSNISAGPRNHN